MSDQQVTIDLHNGWSRGAQRLLRLTFPLWGIFCPIAVFFGAQKSCMELWMATATLITLVGFFCSYCVRNNQLVLKNGLAQLPIVPYMNSSFSLYDVVSVTLYKPSIIEVYFRARLPRLEPVYTSESSNLWILLNDHRIVDIGIRSLSGGRLEQLLSEIKRAAPDVCIDRRVLTETNYPVGSIAPNLHSAVIIKYGKQTLLTELRRLLLSHEMYFWRVWSVFWASVAAFFYVDIFLRFLTGAIFDIDSYRNGPVSVLERIGSLAIYLIESVGRAPVVGYCKIVMTPQGTAVILGIAAVLICIFIAMSLRANELLLTADRLVLRRRMFGMELVYCSAFWTAIESVELVKPGCPSVSDRIQMRLRCGSAPPIYLNLSAIASEEERKLLLNCLEVWAPQATRDPELLLGLGTSQQKSYTELWLQSLAAPPKRERLTALRRGVALKNGRYEIQRQVGAGGQGIAYLAVDRLNESNRVVLKEYLLPVFADRNVRRQALERFEREAKILQGLGHPQIVKWYEYFVEDHRAYLCLEHINGQSLREIWRERERFGQPCSPALAVSLARQMCSILSYLHGLSPPIVHRDFTPDNLILDKSGILKLIDFNVAQAQDNARTSTVVGKHAYLPPEQFRGHPTNQSDIYAFGATIYFLLSGCDPEPLTESDISLVRADIPAPLVDLIRRCTLLEATERCKNMAEISALLDRLCAELGPSDAGCTIRMPEDLFSEIQVRAVR